MLRARFRTLCQHSCSSSLSLPFPTRRFSRTGRSRGPGTYSLTCGELSRQHLGEFRPGQAQGTLRYLTGRCNSARASSALLQPYASLKQPAHHTSFACQCQEDLVLAALGLASPCRVHRRVPRQASSGRVPCVPGRPPYQVADSEPAAIGPGALVHIE